MRCEAATCLIDLEQTAQSFHAHAIPEGIDIRPGDVVTLDEDPGTVAFGDRRSLRCAATVIRASWLAQLWMRLTAAFRLGELYDVGFAPEEAP